MAVDVGVEAPVRVIRKITRLTLDLDAEQSRFLRLFAIDNDIQGSLVVRALLSILEEDIGLAHKVIEDIFAPNAVRTNNPLADKTRKTRRFTVDLEAQQHRFLKMFALDNDIKNAVVVRALLFVLETDINVANKVIDVIFSEDEE